MKRAPYVLVAAALLLSACGGGGSSPVGTWGVDEAGEPSLELADDGSYSGTDGCNRLAGSWEQDGDTVSFGDDGISTLMACEGVDTWLSGLASATIDDDLMTVLGLDGEEIGTLDRQ